MSAARGEKTHGYKELSAGESVEGRNAFRGIRFMILYI